MGIHKKSLIRAFLKSKKVKLASGKLGEVTDFDPLGENSEFEITTDDDSFWVDRKGKPADCKCTSHSQFKVIDILEE
ncbi:TPA: hypothetical protein QB252_001733 [Pasteurella multocida]|nr:hypothetical protein [Pasteurella multocida]